MSQICGAHTLGKTCVRANNGNTACADRTHNWAMTVTTHRLARMVRRPRLLGAALVSVGLFALLSRLLPPTRAMLLAFDGGVAVFLMLMALLMLRATPQSMRQRAQLQNEGKWPILLMSLGLCAIVLAALSGELHAAKDKSLADIALASSSIFLTWLFVAIIFAQQYAHSYYLATGLLGFPGTQQPDYWDFCYFSLVLSMCCQTSDVVISSGSMRKLVMLHSVVAYFFNVIIIALTVNVVAGVL